MGSNLPDGEARLRDALQWLCTILSDVSHSGIYTSSALKGDGTYFNVVVRGFTTLSVEEFEKLAKEKETKNGRIRPSEEVALDIDLISLGSAVVRPAELCRLYFLQGMRALANNSENLNNKQAGNQVNPII